MHITNEQLLAHAYGRKRNALSKATREAEIEKLNARDAEYRAKGSTAERYAIGAHAVEVVARELSLARGCGMIVIDENGTLRPDFCCRPTRMWDGKLYGKPAEIKTGGTVCYNPPADWTEDDILRNKKYVAFCLTPQAEERYLDPDNTDDEVTIICDLTAIISREMFLSLCAQASRKGLRGTFHITGKNKVLAFQPTPLTKLREMIKELIDHGEVETLEGYLLSRAE